MKISAWVSLAAVSLSCMAHHGHCDTFEQTFREPKTVLFSVAGGGSSHVNWVLTVLEQVAARGHRVIYAAKDDHTRYGRAYPSIETASIGPASLLNSKDFLSEENSHPKMLDMVAATFDVLHSDYERELAAYKELFATHNIDMVICDHFAVACMDATRDAKTTPLVVTATNAMFPDAGAPYINNDILSLGDPTTQYQGIWKRFENKFMRPFQLLMKVGPKLNKLAARKTAAGIPTSILDTPDVLLADNLKIINSVFGLEAARPLGPLVEMVGPVLPKHYEPLSGDLKYFLEAHSRVAYVSFGQHVIPSREDIELILTALVENLDEGTIDGFIWATSAAAPKKVDRMFPATVTAASNRVYDIKHMLQGDHPDCRIIRWAPQVGILRHNATITFISHGGASSVAEALHTGVRLVIYPFFSDQPTTARLLSRAEVAGFMSHEESQEQGTEVLRRVLKDEQGIFQKNTDRYQALIQIYSKTGAIRGADLIEEVLFVSDGANLPHRQVVSRHMSFVKANNIDLYAILFALVSLPVVTLAVIIKHFCVSEKAVIKKPKTA
ncbi:uncharacterized protein BYT42DRAFT_563750 [Radiomyces spectabilis]|uniref:uncharacterized protein n=1 Tax=Radiomyces spectabilis TaxID=64574 RepID=UPI00221EB3DB|nr:uncharacterized protein BYT42DRAFT_563750 [Radiomyces spectabilis]KAI8384822.1 hypothetical protein BYT42DRAFT_563750 [Radiomyces spectabilis]